MPALIAALSSLANWSLAAGFTASIIAGILRIVTLLGIGVGVYEGLDVLFPLILQVFDRAQMIGGGVPSGPHPLAQVFALLKVRECIALLLSAYTQRIALRTAFILTKSATGGT